MLVEFTRGPHRKVLADRDAVNHDLDLWKTCNFIRILFKGMESRPNKMAIAPNDLV